MINIKKFWKTCLIRGGQLYMIFWRTSARVGGLHFILRRLIYILRPHMHWFHGIAPNYLLVIYFIFFNGLLFARYLSHTYITKFIWMRYMIRSCSDCYALTLVKGRGYVSLCMAQWNLLLLLCGYLLIHMYILQSVFCIAFDALCSEVKGLYIVLRWKVYISHVLIYCTPCTGLCLPTATFASSLTSPSF